MTTVCTNLNSQLLELIIMSFVSFLFDMHFIYIIYSFQLAFMLKPWSACDWCYPVRAECDAYHRQHRQQTSSAVPGISSVICYMLSYDTLCSFSLFFCKVGILQQTWITSCCSLIRVACAPPMLGKWQLRRAQKLSQDLQQVWGDIYNFLSGSSAARQRLLPFFIMQRGAPA
jgi:hypothetical protein